MGYIATRFFREWIMFRKPEELIMAILLLLWVVVAYFLADYATASHTKYTLMITAFNLIWAIVSFVSWKFDKWAFVLPLLVGALVACWLPWLDWFAFKDILATQGTAVLVVERPWYADWIFKGIVVLIPIIATAVIQFRQRRQRQLQGKI